MDESTEHVTVVPDDLYDEMLTDTAIPVVNEPLRDAAERARDVINKK